MGEDPHRLYQLEQRGAGLRRLLAALALLLFSQIAAAQPANLVVETNGQALAEDAAQYAEQYRVDPIEALRRLRAQQASVEATDAIAKEFASRLAGISIEHSPTYRIVVLLTRSEAVADRTIAAGNVTVPVVFRVGARATRAQAVAAMRRHLIDFSSDLPGSRGAGYDQRTGEVVLLVRPADAQRLGLDLIRRRAEQVSGVPVRVVANDLIEANMEDVLGGGRIEGPEPVTGHRSRCTTGFVVTDGERTGVATAAHCADTPTYIDRDGTSVELPFIVQSGLGYRDVQVNLAPGAKPYFYADRRAGSLRPLATWRNRDSTRAGDFVCHYGESSGYSCAEVELTDYAPPGTLCGGPCSPTWVTVKGPSCVAGDSGGPVFSGEVAFGIAKGVNRSADGQCLFYYYMSTDYLPEPWRLLTAGDSKPGRADGAVSRRR